VPSRLAADGGATKRVLIEMVHAHREEVAKYLAGAGFKPANELADLADFRRG
jgi:hypothetical protein